MPHPVDLNELANMPGFGAAKTVLQKAGHWDEYAGTGLEREFTIEIEGTAPIRATITVKARSKAEAEKKADDKISRDLVDWQVDASMADIDSLEIRDSQEGW